MKATREATLIGAGIALLASCAPQVIEANMPSRVPLSLTTYKLETPGLQVREQALLLGCTTSSQLLIEKNLNKPSSVTGLSFISANTRLLQYEVQVKGTNDVGNFEMCVSGVNVNGLETPSAILTFFDKDQNPVSYQHDEKDNPVKPDAHMYTRKDVGEKTVIGINGIDDKGNVKTLMTVTLDKLPTNADLTAAVKDIKNIQEVQIFNPLTGEKIIIPQEGSLSTSQAASEPSQIEQLVTNIFAYDASPASALGQPAQVTPMSPEAAPATPTEAVPVLTLDKPMTEVYDPFNLEAMPTVDSQGVDVSSGLLKNTLMEHWKQEGIINPDGSVNLPPGVIPAKPEDWKSITSGNGTGLGIGPKSTMILWNDYDVIKSTYNTTNSPFQPSTELFKISDNLILVTEKLYFYDKSGKLQITPVFFISDTNLSGYHSTIFMNFGQTPVAPEAFKKLAMNGISTPVLQIDPDGGLETDRAGYIDASTFASEDMQKQRDQILIDINNGAFDPSSLGNIWSVPTGITW